MAPISTAVAPNKPLHVVEELRRYYDGTWLDYRLLWLNKSNYAIHFGYWDGETRSHSGSLTNLNSVLAKRIGIEPGMRVLDAGCGAGGSALWLARTCDVDVVGITPVQSQIDGPSSSLERRVLLERFSSSSKITRARHSPKPALMWSGRSRACVMHPTRGCSSAKRAGCCEMAVVSGWPSIFAAAARIGLPAKPFCEAGCLDGRFRTLRLATSSGLGRSRPALVRSI